MNKKVRVGIIGAGSFSNSHLLGIKYSHSAEVVAICDIVEEKARNQADRYEIPDYYTNYKDILRRDDIDAVTLPLPDQIHKKVTVDALYAGKHVLCEKPMALNIDDCREMIKAAKETGKQLMVGQIGRYTPSFVMARDMVHEGVIGDLFFVESEYAHDYSKIGGQGNWRVTPERHPIIGGGCHAIDLLRMIAGNPSEVFAYANNKVLTDWPIDDLTVAIMKFPDDVVGKVMSSIGCKRDYTMRTV
ncbi:MAG: Gfo/Idh/MocA family oxidoreductase, partial [Clostridiales bacterium]|nr:Gfo/Idh/MocA family oxidoreductase [Clostridiales bacterium]